MPEILSGAVAHGNRSKKLVPGREPRPEELRAAREAAGLTQQQAAELIYTSPRNWQAWEQEQQGRRMPASAFELFMLKTGQWMLFYSKSYPNPSFKGVQRSAPAR